MPAIDRSNDDCRYGRYGGRALCGVCKTKADGLPVVAGTPAVRLAAPVKRHVLYFK